MEPLDPFDSNYQPPSPIPEPPSRATVAPGRMLPPQSLEAERSVLGAILVQNDAIDRAREAGLSGEDFYREAHRHIFETACSLADRREPIDLVSLSEALRSKGWLDRVGGSASLTQLFEDAFDVGNVSHYAKIVREKSILRRMIGICQDISSEAFSGIEDLEAYLDDAQKKVFGVAGSRATNTVVDIKSILMENMEQIEELALRKEDITGFSTGFTDFDKLTTGLHPGQVLVLAARPGMGKTSWFLSALQHSCVDNGKVGIIFSLEMSKEELGFKFLSGLSRIEARRLKTGRLSDRDWQSLAQAADRLAKSKIYIDDSGGLTAMDIRTRCRRLLSREKKLDIIVVDYLQLMSGNKSGKSEASREREISEISRNLKELAKELKCPILALSQLNRGVEQRQDKRPNLSDLRESGAIEQDADMVCFIHREDYYDKDTENRGIAEFIVAKNRAGETQTVRMGWLGQYTLFVNLAKDEPGTPLSSPRPEKGDITL